MTMIGNDIGKLNSTINNEAHAEMSERDSGVKLAIAGLKLLKRKY